jgi:porin
MADAIAESTTSGNYGIYFILDQMLFCEPSPAPSHSSVSLAKSDQGLGGFGRLAFQPYDRNFLNFYFDTGLIPRRDDDTIGLAFAYAQVGSAAGNPSALTRATRQAKGSAANFGCTGSSAIMATIVVLRYGQWLSKSSW